QGSRGHRGVCLPSSAVAERGGRRSTTVRSHLGGGVLLLSPKTPAELAGQPQCHHHSRHQAKRGRSCSYQCSLRTTRRMASPPGIVGETELETQRGDRRRG